MKLTGLQFGQLTQGWCEFRIITDVGELNWIISDVPRDPFAEFQTALTRIGDGLEMGEIYMNLEPQTLSINYNYSKFKIIISFDGIVQAEIDVDITEFAYFISMALRRVYMANSNAFHEKNWSYPIPSVLH